LKEKMSQQWLDDECTDITHGNRTLEKTLPERSGLTYGASVVIPVFNEEALLPSLVRDLTRSFAQLPFEAEILLVENGSSDRTKELAHELSFEFDNVRAITLQQPSYGGALRQGILAASSDIVIIFNADLWSLTFLLDSFALLELGSDLVLGSKCLGRSSDGRHFTRRLITKYFNAFLRTFLSVRSTDTHGMKALRRSKILPILLACRTSREVFDTELVLRSERVGITISELPVVVRDVRPARLSLLRRIPSTFADLVRIALTL